MFFIDFDIPPWMAKLIGHIAGVSMVGMSAITLFLLISLFGKPHIVLFIAFAVCLGISAFLGVAAVKLLRHEERPDERLFPPWIYKILEVIFGLMGLVFLPIFWLQWNELSDYETITGLSGIFGAFWLAVLSHQATQD